MFHQEIINNNWSTGTKLASRVSELFNACVGACTADVTLPVTPAATTVPASTTTEHQHHQPNAATDNSSGQPQSQTQFHW